ncbi:MAG: hypothetical protein AB7H88_18115 [Vicinamibacterales bacterium]
MAKLTEGERAELAQLRNVLSSIEAFLKWVVSGSDFVDIDLRAHFTQALPSVGERIEVAIRQLSEVRDTEEQLWRLLAQAGLVGASLNLKLTLGRRMAERATQPAKPPMTGITTRSLQPLLKWMNSFLGSLATALPGVELVKEYKDSVELVVENQRRRRSPPPASIFRF